MEMEKSTPQVDQTAPAKPIVPVKQGEENLELQITRETVEELLSLMKVKARVSTSFGEADDLTGKTPVLVDIHGDDLSILIGKRSETLNALQYVTRLIVGKILGYVLVISIDVEGFRSRREKQLRQLARRMADQAVKTGRKQVLEPMPANERRIVHIEGRFRLVQRAR